MTVITSKDEGDAPARAHTRANARSPRRGRVILADNDLEIIKSKRHIRFSAPARIEAARLAAEWLTDWLKVEQPSWTHIWRSDGRIESKAS